MCLTIPEPAWLLQVEAVNIDSVIEDTGQLSVRRGGSIAMREAVHAVNKVIKSTKGISEVEEIRSGGSTGLFRFRANENNKTELEGTLRGHLNGSGKSALGENLGKVLPQIGFVVSAVEMEPSTAEVVSRRVLLAKNRLQQMRIPSIYFGDLEAAHDDSPEKTPACFLEGCRPASSKKKIDKKEECLSRSVHARYQYGADQKNSFINREMGCPPDVNKFTKDLKDLSEWSLKESPEVAACKDKIAVLYFDGNHFNKHQAELSLNKVMEFDNKLREKRTGLLKALVNSFKSKETMKNGEALRLEVLLWGGDEILLVVPAWAGFATLHLFYQEMEGLEINGVSLTHAGGLVFCSHNTPIQRVSRLARELAEHAKMFSRNVDLYFPLLLESEDYPTERISRHWKRRYEKCGAHILPFKPLYAENMEDDKDNKDMYKLDSFSEKIAGINIHGAFRRDVVKFYNSYERTATKVPKMTCMEEVGDSREIEKIEDIGKIVSDIFPLIDKASLQDSALSSSVQQEHEEYYGAIRALQPWLFALEYWEYLQNPLKRGKP
ncbi:MAG: hypothetical protein GXP09_10315 [Gammaproteobacteria bacterium]|nr:hypothetical protein [Gammaproteobacteria bacterium]